MAALKGKKRDFYFALLAVAGVCTIIAGTQAGLLFYSSPETQRIIESDMVPYEQKRALLYADAIRDSDPLVREYAFMKTSVKDPGGDTILYVCNLWDDVNRNWKVVSDPPGPEYISSSPETIKADLRGDCDDYSVLLSGLSAATGAKTRIVNVEGRDGAPGHAYPEYRLGTDKPAVISQCRYISVRYDCDRVYYSFSSEGGKTVYWLNLDWAEGRKPDTDYYIYGDSSNYHELVHPGQSYTGAGQRTVFYYPDGSYREEKAGYGYYAKNRNNEEVLNVI